MTVDRPGWMEQFQIQSEVDLDFVIGQGGGLPVGMTSRSPAEFKRRVLAAMISYTMQLKSIDCTLKQYVDHDLYETEDESLGETISHYLRAAAANLTRELRQLHTQGELPFGILGAELTLFRLPHALDTARILSNRGLLLEVLPLLQLCLEMIAWAHSAFYISDEAAVVELRAQSCISSLKRTYKSAGKIYGLLSQFTHWGHAVHREFIHLEGETTSVVNASVRYRAISLALCLLVLDVLVEVVRMIYRERSDTLVRTVQGVGCPDPARNSYQYVSKISAICGLKAIKEIQSLLQ